VGSSTDKILEHIGRQLEQAGERWRDELRAGFAQTSEGLRIDAARVVPLDGRALALGNGGPCRLLGWSLRNSGATPAVLNFRDGRDTSADMVATVNLGTNSAWQHDTKWFGPTGLAVTDALFLELTGGTMAGAVYLGAVD
jgi:hypothetical protein